MAKYGKKSQAESATSQSAVEDGPLRTKSKSSGDGRELDDKVPGNPEMEIKIKKKHKKKRRDEDTEEVALDAEGDVTCLEIISEEPTNKTKRKKKKNTEKEEENPSSPAEASGSLVETTEFVNKKKKKKKRKSPELQCDVTAEETEDTESNQVEPTQECPLEGMRKRAVVLPEAAEGEEQEVTGKQKRKKCKKDKARDGVEEEELRPKKKKKKKSKE